MYGIVVLMDILGVSSYSLNQCKEYLEKQKILIDALTIELGGLDEEGYKRNIANFGDTIVICWPINPDDETDYLTKINYLSWELRQIIFWGLKNELLFRGCISVGEYVFEGNSILGPAIFDAHDWYESSDWFGIIFSPKARLWLEYLAENEKIDNLAGNIVLYENVPLNHRMKEGTKEFWCVAWPRQYYENLKTQNGAKIIIKTPKESFLRDLFKTPQSKESETKFKNSIDFFEWYCRKYPINNPPIPKYPTS